MIACDRCRNVDVPATEFKVALIKLTPGAERVSRTEVKAGTVELCDGCVQAVWDALIGALPRGTQRFRTTDSEEAKT